MRDLRSPEAPQPGRAPWPLALGRLLLPLRGLALGAALPGQCFCGMSSRGAAWHRPGTSRLRGDRPDPRGRPRPLPRPTDAAAPVPCRVPCGLPRPLWAPCGRPRLLPGPCPVRWALPEVQSSRCRPEVAATGSWARPFFSPQEPPGGGSPGVLVRGKRKRTAWALLSVSSRGSSSDLASARGR